MYNKEGKIKLETSAHYVPIGNTNITFYDSDIGTADLIFYITRNQRPLEVSDENVDCFLMLKANDGTYIVDTAHVIEPMNGKVKYTVPKEFLTHTGSVKGQVWIAVHGKEDMITEVEFSFTIKDSMFTTTPAVDKLNYIRTFENLRERIEDRVQYIEESLANGNDYVTQMDDTFQSGMKSLNDRSQQVINEIKALADNHKQELNDLKDKNITELDNKANQIKEDIEELNNYDTSNWQKSKLTRDNGILERVQYIDLDNPELIIDKTCFVYVTLVENPPESSATNGFLFFYIRTADYMKMEYRPYNSDRVFYRTKFNGTWLDWTGVGNDNTRQWLGTLGTESSGYNSVLNLPPGFYEATIPSDAWEVDAPLDPNGASYIASIDVYEGNDKRKQIKLVSSYRNDIYHATVHIQNEDNPNGRFMGWKRVMNAEEYEEKNSDTGWIHWDTLNEVTERETDNPKAVHNYFRIVKTNGLTKGYLRININNFKTQSYNSIVGSIPKEYVPKVQNFYVRTPVSSNPAVLLLDTDGSVKVFLNTNDMEKWNPSGYITGEVSWVIDEEGVGI